MSLHKIKNIYMVVKIGLGVKTGTTTKKVLHASLHAWLRSNKTLPIF